MQRELDAVYFGNPRFTGPVERRCQEPHACDTPAPPLKLLRKKAIGFEHDVTLTSNPPANPSSTDSGRELSSVYKDEASYNMRYPE